MKNFSKKSIGILIISLGFLLGGVANAASLEDAKQSISNGNGVIVHPNLYRELTSEEKEEYKDWPNPPTKMSKEMTKEEAEEYFSYIDKYQQENNSSEVPQQAYDYIQYISERLDTSKNSEITDKLRLEAEKYVENGNKEIKTEDNSSNRDSLGNDTKESKQKSSFWKKLFNLSWFK